MTWWQPLLDIYEQHLIDYHSEQGEYELHHEYNMMEQHLIYEKFRHGELESICCDFCSWRKHFTINFDILVREGEEE
jgi:hypothetical protein